MPAEGQSFIQRLSHQSFYVLVIISSFTYRAASASSILVHLSQAGTVAIGAQESSPPPLKSVARYREPIIKFLFLLSGSFGNFTTACPLSYNKTSLYTLVVLPMCYRRCMVLLEVQ